MLAPLLRKTWVLLVVACSVGMPLGALIAEPTRNVTLSGPPHVSEDARFPSENGALLAGTLEKPDWTGPFPVAVIISGTGPWTRGSSWDFELVRARLLAKGIATFRYDKRGLGQSTGTFVDTLPAMERDVAAAVGYLRTRRDIDPDRIALIGHSQGAAAVPVVASRDPRIAAVVMLSGPVGRRGELFVETMKANLATGGKSQTEIERITAATEKWMHARSVGSPTDEIARLRQATVDAFAASGFTREQAEGAVKPLDGPVVLSMFEIGTQEALAQLRAPVLVVYGSADRVISPAASIPAAETALTNNHGSLVVDVPGFNHGLSLGDPTTPVVPDLIGDWLGARLQRAAVAPKAAISK